VPAPQALFATTESVPETKPAGTLKLTEIPVLFPIKLQPAGAVQLYLLAPVTAAIEYVKDPPAQRFVLVPIMVPGEVNVERIASERTVLFPQVFVANTVTLPVANTAGSVTEMLLLP
jgi:hypothetical protein